MNVESEHQYNRKLVLKTESKHQGVIVSVLTLSATDRGFESWLDQAKDYKISICYFSSKKGGV
jgi:hypothetical protein